MNHPLPLHLLIMQDPGSYKIYTEEVKHTKLGYSYLHVLRHVVSAWNYYPHIMHLHALEG